MGKAFTMKGSAQAIFDYIFGLTVPGVKLELSRVQELMDRIGRPHEAYPVIHIAGTNGKGSTAAMLSAQLGSRGYKVGLFTSPHLIRPNERIRIGRELVPDAFIMGKVDSWRSHIDELGITFFEVLTALGMTYFKEQAVDYAVLETGLGGRLDATNVVDPILSIITSVSMDHENILGDDLATISGEKAGIIKKGKPVVLGKNPEVVQEVIRNKSRDMTATLKYVPDEVDILERHYHAASQAIRLKVGEQELQVDLPLLGDHQIENFSNVLVALKVMGLELDQESIQQGLNELNWSGRMQILQTDPLVMYDVAHNPEGLQRLLEALTGMGRTDTIIIAAFNARKKIDAMLHQLKTWSGKVIYSVFDGHSSFDAAGLAALGIPPDDIAPDLHSAYERAVIALEGGKGGICFIGSHYMAESVFPMFAESEGSANRPERM